MISRRGLILGSGAAIAGGALVAPRAGVAAAAEIALPKDIAPAAGPQITVTKAPNRGNLVAMTFDDGPHPKLTPQLLDILQARKIRATFYVIGERVVRYPDIVKRMVDEGHEIGNHSWRHPFLSKLAAADILDEIDRTSEAVYSAVQRLPVTLRPPYGALKASQREMIHRERALPTVLWSVDPEDWRKPGAGVVAERIVDKSHAGAIILSHDIHAATVKAMPAALDGLSAQGYRFATVSMLMGRGDWSRRRWSARPKVTG